MPDRVAPDANAEMIDHLRRTGQLRDRAVANAMRRVARHAFVPDRSARRAYADSPLDIGHGQTISAPHMVALMLQPARLGPGDNVLDVGAGSGYLAAVAAELVRPDGRVTAIEVVPELAKAAGDVLAAHGYGEVTVVEGDGSAGCVENAPYDAILVSAAAPSVPEPLVQQLAPGGRLVVPVGDRSHQHLVLVTNLVSGRLEQETLVPCRFVPLVGEHGW